MARLKAARMSDSTLVSSVDDNITDLEQAISEIIGIPLDEEILGSILGVVNADATVTGVLRFKGAGSDPVATIGIEIDDTTNTEKFRIVAVGGNLTLYQWDTDDYPNLWEPINVLSTPVISIEQLSEMEGWDLKDYDEQVLAIDATDPDDVKFTPITAVAAGSVEFPNLTDVSDTIYADAVALDLIRVNADKDGLETIAADIVGSDIQEIGDLSDVLPETIVDADRGKDVVIGWEQDAAVYKVEYAKHIFAYGSFNKEVSAGGVSGARAIPSTAKNSTWTPILLNGEGDTPVVDGLGYDASIITIGSADIVLPEPGPYLVDFSVTWRWQYDQPQEPTENPNPTSNVAPHIRRAMIKSTDAQAYVGVAPLELIPEYDWWFPNVVGGVIVDGIPALQQPPDRVHSGHSFGTVYALTASATLQLQVQQFSGDTRWVHYAHVFIAKLR